MNEPIVSRNTIHALGREAFEAGKPRDSHEMNWHALCLPDWLAGYDEAAAEARRKLNDMRHDHQRWPRVTV